MTPDHVLISDSAVLFTLGNAIDISLSHRIATLAAALPADGIIDRVPSYITLLIRFDPHHLNVEHLIELVSRHWAESGVPAALSPEAREIEIPVVYGGRYGPDLAGVARYAGLSIDEVISRHSAAFYSVGAIGFSPGFGYLIGLPTELATPRLPTPRLRVPEGSVAIGAAQSAVYPVETAGGWNIIGRTSRLLFESGSPDPFLLRVGDTVRFRAVSRISATAEIRKKRKRSILKSITVLTSGLLTTVQDLGRHGHGAFGISPNGAADQTASRLANRLVGNDQSASVLEITLVGPHLRFDIGVICAITGEGPGPRLNGQPISRNQAFQAYLGDHLEFEPIEKSSGARCYLAIAGGFDVPVVMGSRSTDLVAGIGGIEGRALIQGDVLSAGKPTHRPIFATVPEPTRTRTRLRIMPGPQRSRFSDTTWHRLTQREFRVTNDANRVGIRLEGPALQPRQRIEMISEGVVTGSIQIPGSGQPIVLLPGRATIGGYPKIATVIDQDLDLLGQLRPGDIIRFRAATHG